MGTRRSGAGSVSAPRGVSPEYCDLRSGGLEKMQLSNERRMDGQSKKIDELARASVQLAAAVERVSLILEKQDARLDRLESRSPFAFLETAGGKSLFRMIGIALLILLSAGVGVNIIELLKEVL